MLFFFPDDVSLAAPSNTTFYASPVPGVPQIVRKFEKPAKKWMPGHRGIDIVADAGEDIFSPAEGEVIFAGKVVNRTVITVKHPDGRLSSFEPVINPLPQGSRVSTGDVIAQVDPEIRHCQPNFCLHWGVRENKDEYINPLILLNLEEPSILLPIGDDFAA